MGAKLTSLAFEWYVPIFSRTRIRHLQGEDPEPLRIEIKYPSWGAMLQARGLTANGRIPTQQEELDFLGAHLRRVENLEVNGVPVLTGAELIALKDQLPGDLFVELQTAVTNLGFLEAGQSRHLPSRPGSGSGSTPETAGTAGAVGNGSSTA